VRKKLTIKQIRTILRVCHKCGLRPPREGKDSCAVCVEERRKAASDRVKDRLDRGRCVNCGVRAPEAGKKRCSRCAEEAARTARTRVRAVVAAYRQTVLDHYGSRCACCAESNPLFLTVDHMNNDGAKHRKEVPASKLYPWLIANQFPDGFQLLCYNCNCGKQRNGGVCPHTGGGVPFVSSNKAADAAFDVPCWRPPGWRTKKRRR
jgi:hypothetical protein